MGDSTSFPPTYPPFDVFCFGPCGSLSTIEFYRETTIWPAGQWYYDTANDSIRLVSGEVSEHQALAKFEVDTAIPDEFTVEWIVRFDSMPIDFSDSGAKYIHLGAGSRQGYAAGLMFSEEGIAFVPCPEGAPTVTPQAGTHGLIAIGSVYVIYVVVTQASTQVSVTESSEYVQYGHKMRFSVSSVESSTCSGFTYDRAWAFVQGVYSDKVCDIRVSEFCLSSNVQAVPYPPIADAGPDQAVPFCSILQLDGSASYSPDGRTLTYSWHLIDAPHNSGYTLDGVNGWTQPLLTPTGFTNKLYSNDLADLAVGEVRPDDVLVFNGIAYDIIALGHDSTGDYVEISDTLIPDSLSLRAFKIIHQFGFINQNVVKPTFYPDVLGFFKFSLRVYDGYAWSLLSITVASIVAQVLPRGLTPQTNFMWSYLSDFWKLVDDRGRYEVVWSGMMQFFAGELLNLWQHEYAKSLRDIQRTFQRRWLAYQLKYLPARADMTMRVVLAPYDSSSFNTAGVGGDRKSVV
jgi:hypothetical protein